MVCVVKNSAQTSLGTILQTFRNVSVHILPMELLRAVGTVTLPIRLLVKLRVINILIGCFEMDKIAIDCQQAL